mgnify:CR=1 FL=1|jgi:hypothetical protein|tara:strand:- start:331 stop:744 length:414 start_codon:yes stop_codon:yes gene_type:complete
MNLKNGVAKEIRHYSGSLFIFLFVIGIIITLLQFPVLDSNKEVVMMLIGTIAASIPIIISSITGTKPDDITALKTALDKKENQIELLNKSKDEYEKLIINLQEKMLKNQIDLIDQFMFKSAMDYDDKNYGKNNIKNT